jgi:hypothetical protein
MGLQKVEKFQGQNLVGQDKKQGEMKMMKDLRIHLGPPNPLEPSFSIGQKDVEERTFIVNVFPKARQLVVPLEGKPSKHLSYIGI